MSASFSHTYSKFVSFLGFAQKVYNPSAPGASNLASYNSAVMVASVPVVFGTSAYTVQLPLNAIVTEVDLNIVTAFGGGSSPSIQIGSGAYIAAAPATPVVTNVGTTGSTTYNYKLSGFDGAVGTTAASTAGVNTTGNATLTGANYNSTTTTTVVGRQYNVYRTVGGSTQGLIGTFTATSTSSVFNDTGLAATGTTPSSNTTGLDLFNSTVVSSQFLSATAQPLVGGNGQTVYVTLTGSPTSGAAFLTINYYNPTVTVNGIND
jgi:hypothetical protein